MNKRKSQNVPLFVTKVVTGVHSLILNNVLSFHVIKVHITYDHSYVVIAVVLYSYWNKEL